MNPILTLIVNTGVFYPPNVTSTQALKAILHEINNVGAGLSAYTSNGLIYVDIEDSDEPIVVVISESKADIKASPDVLAKPIAAIVAFSVVSAVEQLS
tara:strand:- start:2464 stop:2757 length:294 start_codon:yes stop_codon:yes gene_type:complete